MIAREPSFYHCLAMRNKIPAYFVQTPRRSVHEIADAVQVEAFVPRLNAHERRCSPARHDVDPRQRLSGLRIDNFPSVRATCR